MSVDFSKLDFIRRDSFGTGSDIVVLQEAINDGVRGGVKFGYISGSSVASTGTEFQAFNASGQNLTSGSAAVFGRDSNNRPFLFNRGGGGGTENTFFKIPNLTCSNTISVSDGTDQSGTCTSTYSVTLSSTYGLAIIVDYSIDISGTGTYVGSASFTVKVNGVAQTNLKVERLGYSFAEHVSRSDKVLTQAPLLSAPVSVTSVTLETYANATTSDVGDTCDVHVDCTLHAFSLLQVT